MNSGATRRTDGFTIVETMIVLAVSGALFVAIAASLSGRQNAAEFTNAIQGVQAQIQQTINQVAEGYYPNQQNFSCVAGGGGPQLTAGASGQGTNQDCVFLGKVMQFGVQNSNPEQYQTYTIAGLRTATTGTGSPFINTLPTVVGVGGNYTDYSDVHALKYGLSTRWVRVGATTIGAVGFLMEPGAADGTTAAGYSSGGQQVDVVPIRPTNVGQTLAQAIGGIEDANSGGGGLRDPQLGSSAPVNPASGVTICFVSGATNQSGLITIGSNGRQLTVKLDIRSNQTCA